MSTSTTKGIFSLVRDRLLTFTPLSGSALSSSLGTKVYLTQAPDDVSYPFAVVDLFRSDTPGLSGFREMWQAQVQFHARPRSEAWVLEGIADVADQAMLAWESRSNGLVFSGYRNRWTLPVIPTPADREVVRIRCLYEVAVWPELFTQYVT